jgi:outer membrane cobalamin receptor
VSVTEPSELVEAIGTTRRITHAEIEAHQARTLDEALQLIPGVYIRTGGDGTPRVDIRGFRSRHVLLLVNGVPANSTSDGQFDPARMSTTGIREIKVSYSSSSLLYGDNALAAVIEIATVDGQPDSTLEISAGTPDQRAVGGRVSRAAGGWSVAAAGTTYSTQGFRLPRSFTSTELENGGRRENSDRERSDIRGSLGYRFRPGISLNTEWSLGAGGYGLPPSTISDADDIFAQAGRYERVEGYRAASGQISVVIAPTQRVQLSGWVYRNAQREDRSRYDDATYTSMDDPLVQGTFQSRERTTVTGSTVLGRLDLLRLGWLRLAVNQRHEAIDSNGVIRDVPLTTGGGGGGGGRAGGGRPGTTAPTFDKRAFSFDRQVEVYSTGAEWQFRASSRLGAALGGGVNWQDRADVDVGAEPQPTWIAGVSYDATPKLRLHASSTRKVRVPSIDQLYNTAAGNASLRPERAYGLDAGAEHRIGSSCTISISAFVMRAKDFIERVGGAPFENRGTYRFAGAEISAQSAVRDWLDVRGAYTFLDSVDVNGAVRNRDLQTRPRHRSRVESTWRPVSRTSLRGSLEYVGRQLFDSHGGQPLQLVAGGYTLIDVGLSHSVTRRYEIAFNVTNAFDELYEQSYGLPREGRTAVLTLRGHFD